MYLKIIRRIGNFDVECFTPEEQQTIQELCYIVSTMPIWADQCINDYDEFRHDYKLRISQDKKTQYYNGADHLTEIRSPKLSQNLTSSPYVVDTVCIRHSTASPLSFDIRTTPNNKCLFSAYTDRINDSIPSLIVENFCDGEWINVLKEIFVRAGAGRVEKPGNFRFPKN